LSAPSNPYGGAVSTPKLSGSAAAGLDSSNASPIALTKCPDLDIMMVQSAISDTKDFGDTISIGQPGMIKIGPQDSLGRMTSRQIF
jgi:hypothetical protein